MTDLDDCTPTRTGAPPVIDRVLSAARIVLDAAVVTGAVGTVVVHLSLVAGWRRDPTAAIWAAVAVIALVALAAWRARRLERWPPAPDGGSDLGPDADAPAAGLRVRAPAVTRTTASTSGTGGSPHPVTVGLLGAALVTAGATALWRPTGPAFVTVWASISAITAGAVWSVASGRWRPPGAVRDAGGWLVLAAATLAAAGSLVIVRADVDDVELVNRSLHVEQDAGPLPTRDTVLADEVYLADRPETPATAIEPLVGMVAALVPVSATTVAHLWLGPAVSLLGVVALHRLLVTARAPAPALAVAAAAVWSSLDGEVLRSLGNTGITRAWQGKTVLLVVIVPVLWHHVMRWCRDGSVPALALAASAGIAAVGVSRTGVFVPLVLVAAVAVAATFTGAARRVPWLALPAAYPLGAGIVGLVAERGDPTPVLAAATGTVRSIVALPDTDAATAWYSVLGRGVGFALGMFAVLTAWAWVGDRLAAIALATVTGLVAALTSAPTALGRLDELTAADAVLWRLPWAIPATAAIGSTLVVGPIVAARLAGLSSPGARRAVGAMAVAGLVGAFAVDGVWIGSAENRGAQIVVPVAWKVPPDALEAAERLVELAPPGGLVAAPPEVSSTLATITLDVRSVAPRDDALKGPIVVPSLLADERRSLSASLEHGSPDAIADGFAADALAGLAIDVACARPRLPAGDGVLRALRAASFIEVGRDEHCTYWRRKG